MISTLIAVVLLSAAGAAQPETEDAAAPPELTGPRDMWNLLSVDESQFDRLTDGVPWQESEDEILHKMLFGVDEFRPEEIDSWARDKFPPTADVSNDMRGQIFRLRGQAVAVEAVPLPERLRERYQYTEYYRCKILLEDGRRAVVFARQVPRQWKRGESIDHRAGAFGFFLKLAGDGDKAEPIFVARRVAWYPNDLLGDLGMDVGLFDGLRPGPLTARSRECFYQLMAAAGRAEPGQLLAAAQAKLRESGQPQFSVVPLFNQPDEQRGRLVVLSGTAREVVLIRVDDEDIRARFGIDHYYQISLFTDDSQGNPVVFCVLDVPADMPVGKGPGYGEYVTVAGFFFNSWAFRNQVPTDDPAAGPQMQLAPLLIGRQANWQPQQPLTSHPMAGAIAAGVFVLVLLVIWLALWRRSRSDKQFHDQVLARHLGGTSDVPVDPSKIGPPPDSESQGEQP